MYGFDGGSSSGGGCTRRRRVGGRVGAGDAWGAGDGDEAAGPRGLMPFPPAFAFRVPWVLNALAAEHNRCALRACAALHAVTVAGATGRGPPRLRCSNSLVRDLGQDMFAAGYRGPVLMSGWGTRKGRVRALCHQKWSSQPSPCWSSGTRAPSSRLSLNLP